jgi:hypothetical protein
MEMAMEVNSELGAQVDRLVAAAAAMEQAVAKLQEIEVAAAVSREADLEERLGVAEATIAMLRGQGGRKTLPAGVATLMAKSGVAEETTNAAALDASLAGLSIEQRIAVKAQMLRAGLIG